LKMLSPKWQEVVSKWLPFWNRLTTDQKWLYLKMFEAGEFSLQALSMEAHFEFDWIQRANLNFIEKNFSAEDIAFLDTFSEQDHKDLILECFVRTMPPEERDRNWEIYENELEARKPKLHLPQLIKVVNKKLLNSVSNNSDLLFTITDREFEQLTAEIFEAEGYNVQLTKRTRDNGFDIIAIYNSLIQQKLLIECKRKRDPNAKIPVSVVRAVLGAFELSGEGANKIVLVTTNRYTDDAKEAISRSSIWRIDLKDYNDVITWLGKHKNTS